MALEPGGAQDAILTACIHSGGARPHAPRGNPRDAHAPPRHQAGLPLLRPRRGLAGAVVSHATPPILLHQIIHATPPSHPDPILHRICSHNPHSDLHPISHPSPPSSPILRPSHPPTLPSSNPLVYATTTTPRVRVGTPPASPEQVDDDPNSMSMVQFANFCRGCRLEEPGASFTGAWVGTHVGIAVQLRTWRSPLRGPKCARNQRRAGEILRALERSSLPPAATGPLPRWLCCLRT